MYLYIIHAGAVCSLSLDDGETVQVKQDDFYTVHCTGGTRLSSGLTHDRVECLATNQLHRSDGGCQGKW